MKTGDVLVFDRLTGALTIYYASGETFQFARRAPDSPETPGWSSYALDTVMADVVRGGTGILKDGERVDPRDLYEPPT